MPAELIIDAKNSSSRGKRRERSRSMPLSQAWYKVKQINISPNQKRVLRELWPDYGIDLVYNKQLDISELFPAFDSKYNKVVIDVGFGVGNSLLAMSGARKEDCFIGIEIHRAGIAKALQAVRESNSRNVRIIRVDFTMLLEGKHLPEASVDEVCVFFPDPWPNEYRDGNRRVIRNQIITMLERVVKKGGLLRIATDVDEYAEHVGRVMNTRPNWGLEKSEVHAPGEGSSWARERSYTNYEQKAAREHRMNIYEFMYQLNII